MYAVWHWESCHIASSLKQICSTFTEAILNAWPHIMFTPACLHQEPEVQRTKSCGFSWVVVLKELFSVPEVQVCCRGQNFQLASFHNNWALIVFIHFKLLESFSIHSHSFMHFWYLNFTRVHHFSIKYRKQLWHCTQTLLWFFYRNASWVYKD